MASEGDLRAEISSRAAVARLDAAQPSLEPPQPRESAENLPDATHGGLDVMIGSEIWFIRLKRTSVLLWGSTGASGMWSQ